MHGALLDLPEFKRTGEIRLTKWNPKTRLSESGRTEVRRLDALRTESLMIASFLGDAISIFKGETPDETFGELTVRFRRGLELGEKS